MGKLTIKTQGNRVGELNVKLGDMTIGRYPECDIVLKDDKSVSGRHAVIKTVGSKSTIEDLDSTNGTFIENARVKRHDLEHGDTIIIGAYELRYRDVAASGATGFSAISTAPPESSQENTRIITAHAQLIALDGKDKGKRIALMKEETLLDNPGKNPARISRTAYGYMLTAKVGPGEPRLNDKPVPPSGQLLENGDIIYIAATRYQLSL
ncbi:MAG: FHA domain-containing protein [Sulfuricaulis sp.]|nr:FHA domain-containing protein [Sulfuricaulis sp.]